MQSSKFKQSQMNRNTMSTNSMEQPTRMSGSGGPINLRDETSTKNASNVVDRVTPIATVSDGDNLLLKIEAINVVTTPIKKPALEIVASKPLPMRIVPKAPISEIIRSNHTSAVCTATNKPSIDAIAQLELGQKDTVTTGAKISISPPCVAVHATADAPIVEAAVNNLANNHFEGTDDRSGMDTLAEIAAISSKLDTSAGVGLSAADKNPSKSLQKKVPPGVPEPSTAIESETSARTVASEYLKMTSAEYLKAHSQSSVVNGSVANEATSFLNNVEREACSEKASTVAKPVDSSSDTDNSDGILKLQPSAGASASERGPAAPATALISARTVVVGEDGFKIKSSVSSELPVTVTFPRGNTANATARTNAVFNQEDGGRSVCTFCKKTFLKKHQMVLHMNIHYMNPCKFKCEPCGVNFRTRGILQKHERSDLHKTKVYQKNKFGEATPKNPRPYECYDCNKRFRIQGHLAKHLRSKTHVQKLEYLQKLPIGTYAEIERAGISLTDIDTTDCDNSLASLKLLAQKLLLDKDPSDETRQGEHWGPEGQSYPSISGRTKSNSEDGELLEMANHATKGDSDGHNGDPLSPANDEPDNLRDDDSLAIKRRKFEQSNDGSDGDD